MEKDPSTSEKDFVGQGFSAILHIDLDCFFVQVERRKDPTLGNVPVAVHQHDDIISVSYEARRLGVKKHDTPQHVQRTFPQVKLVHVEKLPGSSKVSYQVYNDSSAKVLAVIKEIIPSAPIEKASIDEAYVDVTEVLASSDTSEPDSVDDLRSSSKNYTLLAHVPGGSDAQTIKSTLTSALDSRLWSACDIALKIRQRILAQTGFTASAGIATGKLLAKLCSNMNKPDKQTVLLFSRQSEYLDTLRVPLLPKIGIFLAAEHIQKLNQTTFGSLRGVPRAELVSLYGDKGGPFLFGMCRGSDGLRVTASGPSKTLMCSMSLTPFSDDVPQLTKLVTFVAQDLVQRLTDDRKLHRRVPGSLVFGWRLVNERETSRHLSLAAISLRDDEPIANTASSLGLLCMKQFCEAMAKRPAASWTIRWIGITAGQFKQIVASGMDRFVVTSSRKKPPAAPLAEDGLSLSMLPASAQGHVDTSGSSSASTLSDVECPFCGKRFTKTLVQQHMDQHFASE